MNQDLNSPQVLIRVADEFEAGAVITALNEFGIQASSTGGFTAGFIPEAPGDVSIIVKKGDLDAAQKALKKIKLSHQSVDWSRVDVGSPEDE